MKYLLIIIFILTSCSQTFDDPIIDADYVWSSIPVTIAKSDYDELVLNINTDLGYEFFRLSYDCDNYCIQIEQTDYDLESRGKTLLTKTESGGDLILMVEIYLDLYDEVIFLHELGHAIGYWHHDDEGVMYYSSDLDYMTTEEALEDIVQIIEGKYERQED